MRTSLVVTPTDETMGRLNAMLESSILTLDFDLMNIEIASVNFEAHWTAEPLTVYDDIMVKEVTTESAMMGAGAVNSLVAYVQSAKLAQRAALLDHDHPKDMFRWVLRYDVQPGRSTRLAITSLIDVLVYREAPFSFSDEMLLRV